jgi:NAD(P)H dehydrogenase (quinone)
MILVTGATGHLGKTVLDFLLKQLPANALSALVRDPAKGADLAAKGIALRQGDYTDVAALTQAFKGVDTLLFVSSGTIQHRVAQHKNVVEAAKANGVKHIVYTSVVHAAEDLKFLPAPDHYYTEEMLKQSGIAYTFFRNAFYAEVLPMLLGNALADGQWHYAGAEARVSFVSRVDIAGALANVVINPAAHANKIYEITSSNAYTLHEVAAIVSRVIGKQITYTPVSVEVLKNGMKQAGVPDMYIPMMASIAESITAGELGFVDPALENLLKRKPVDLAECLPDILRA